MSVCFDKYLIATFIPYRLGKCIDSCYERDAWRFSLEWNKCINDMELLVNEVVDDSEALALDIQSIGAIVQQNVNDFAVCSTVISEKLLPLVYDSLNQVNLSLPTYDRYELVRSRTGMLSLIYKDNNRLCYNLTNPLIEVQHQADYIFRSESDDIVICGVGLGYLPYLLWEKSYKSADVYILENNADNIEMAKKSGVLNWIDEDKLHIVISENESEMLAALTELPIDLDNAMCWVADWFVDSVKDDVIRDIIYNFSESIMSQKRFCSRYSINEKCNNRNVMADVTLLKEEEYAKNSDFIVVAPGPSLSDGLQYIRDNIGKKKIVSVDAALRRLIAEGIKPDYVVVLDPGETVMRYISGLEKETQELTLVAYNKAYWKYVADFQGKVYGITECIEDNGDDDIHYGVTKCTTVSSLAILTSLYLGASTVEFIGLDLSYPGGKTYAGQVASDDNVRAGEVVKSVNGGMVETSDIFINFKSEIEDIIRTNPEIRFINHSTEGAYIEGTFMRKWWENNSTDCIEYLDKLNSEQLLEWNEKYYLLWQMICKYLKNGQNTCAADDFWRAVTKVFGGVSETFLGSLGTINRVNTINSKFVILLTSLYTVGADEISDKIRNDAYTLKNKHGFDVMIVNTAEYLGGKRVALDSVEIPEPIESPVNAECVFYMGERFSYFGFSEGMPDTNQIRTFLEAISECMPVSFIAYDSLSLVAAACKLIGNVEYR